jgi:hypothetical protein
MRSRVIAIVITLVVGLGVGAAPAVGHEPSAKEFRNCTALNRVYPHGVGRPNAVDKTRNGSPKVRNFKKSRPLYRANRSKDRDDDGIACEKL